MSTKSLIRSGNFVPTIFNDLFKPWNEWFDTDVENALSVPAVNVTEDKDQYRISVAAPGLKKNDFNIDVNGNLLTISAETESSKEEKEKKFTRREYNYSSFSRTFTLPEAINKEKIDAVYENGELKLVLPKKEEAKKSNGTKKIAIK